MNTEFKRRRGKIWLAAIIIAMSICGFISCEGEPAGAATAASADSVETEAIPAVFVGKALDQNGEKEDIPGKGKQTVIASIAYVYLPAGEKYTFGAALYEYYSGEPVLLKKKEVTASRDIRPEQMAGAVTLELKFDAGKYAGKTLLVRASCWNAEKLLWESDANDADQMIHVRKPGEKARPETPVPEQAKPAVRPKQSRDFIN
ncbi:MAG: VaFE repeat-containing surface-anchored protein [Firmicutes bacterium]|nr:VaFE repeat-containing surface-anchored protein [Bacillota bacterium]